MKEKKITIDYSNNYKALSSEGVSRGTSFFEDAQRRAKKQFEIITQAYAAEDEKERDLQSECYNNIIAFVGERGQGKTTAMNCFVRALKEDKDSRCIVLPTVDPSTFEEMHNVVEVVLSKMYCEIKEKIEKDNKNYGKYTEILSSFQLVYEGLALVRNPKKFDDLENDYEGTIEKIARVGDSVRLKREMYKLVNEFLVLQCKTESGGNFLDAVHTIDK